jgi:hypothetical protein
MPHETKRSCYVQRPQQPRKNPKMPMKNMGNFFFKPQYAYEKSQDAYEKPKQPREIPKMLMKNIMQPRKKPRLPIKNPKMLMKKLKQPSKNPKLPLKKHGTHATYEYA